MARFPTESDLGSMHALRRSRRRGAWALLVTFALLFAGLLHVAHAHEGSAPSSPHKFCVACAVLDRSGGAAPPPHVAAAIAPPPLQIATAGGPAPLVRIAAALRTPCCPRAPPASLHA